MEDSHPSTHARSSPSTSLSTSVSRVIRRHQSLALLVLVLVVAALARLAVYPSVFRGDTVVLLSNDPYYYRFVVERHVAAANDFGALFIYDDRDPLLIVALSVVVWVVGEAHLGVVLAWYPVVVGLVTVGLVALVTLLLTGSRLAGLVAAAVLALSPTHVTRTALGFADHHAADYLWLVVTMLVLLALFRAHTRRRRLLLALGLALSLTVQVFLWEAGVVLVVPAAAAVSLAAVIDAPASRRSTTSLFAGGAFLVAGGLVLALSALFAWNEGALVTAFAAIGTLVFVVTLLSHLVGAVDAPRPVVVGVVTALTALAAGVVASLSAVGSVFAAGEEYYLDTVGSGVAETVSLVGGPLGLVTGPLSLFGLGLFVALPYVVLETVGLRRRYTPGRLTCVVAVWFFFGLALVQRRFAGELSPFVAVFVGIAFVDLAWRSGLLETDPLAGFFHRVSESPPPVGRLLPVAFALLIVLSAVASSGFLAIRLNQSVVPEAEYDAARAIDDYAAARDITYPDSYVLSPLGSNRLFNYETSGQSARDLSYRFAEATYPVFRVSETPDRQYERLHDRVGFVVTTDVPDSRDVSPGSMQALLHDRLGSASDTHDGTGHFRLVYGSADGSVNAFALVPGAVIAGQADPGTTVSLSTPVTAGDRSFTYTRETTATAAGWYAITVPYPGTYTVDGQPVEVAERDVLEGRFVHRSERPGDGRRAHWTFTESRGSAAFDQVGGYHGRVVGSTWVDEGLRLDGTGGVTVQGLPTPTADTGLALTVRVEGIDEISRTDPEPTRFPRLVSAAPAGKYTRTAGYQLGLVDGQVVGALGDGSTAVDLRGPAIDDGEAHTVSLLWDGAVVRLVVDGRVVDDASYTGSVTPSETLVVGATTDERYHLRGTVTDLHLEFTRASEVPARQLADDADS